MASVKCKSCRGSGQVLKWVYTDPNTQQRVAVVCGCATRRFLKKHRERIIIQPDGAMTWKEAA